MKVSGHIGSRSWQVDDLATLTDVLSWRDPLGGAIFFVQPDNASYPYMCIRLGGDLADLVFYPAPDCCGLRCLGEVGLPPGGLTTLLYEGSDPGSGEEVPNEFIVPFATACRIAAEYLESGGMPQSVSWFDLEGDVP